jgi:hypothetical protein
MDHTIVDTLLVDAAVRDVPRHSDSCDRNSETTRLSKAENIGGIVGDLIIVVYRRERLYFA